MRPDKQQLIDDLLQDEPRQAAHLQAGVRALRRRRNWRTARRRLSGLFLLAAIALGLHEAHPRRWLQLASAPPAAPTAQASRRGLTDDQLLALFPGTPVALATLPDGTKRLIFPRPEDAQRFLRYP